ncbi:MAG: Xaa-Pro aminopeptidase [Frankiales bacterium]|nr:Xaa-Pro aminopeptidase [Frankiales bacterium]
MNERPAEPAAAAPDDGEPASYDIPLPAGLAAAISRDWEPAPRMAHPADRHEAGIAPGAATYGRNRAALLQRLPGRTLVIPAGQGSTRANDTEYAFRARSEFSWLTGETVEGAVLVLGPQHSDTHASSAGQTATLYIREYAGAGEVGYFTNRQHGAIWVGNVPSVLETAAVLGLTVRPRNELGRDLRALDRTTTLAITGFDPVVDTVLAGVAAGELPATIDELRLTKDDWEISQLQAACDATAAGFADVAAELPVVLAAGGGRAERWLEGTFWRRARMAGNDVGYTSILASGAHATTLHWWRNNGDPAEGQLLLADMGVEMDSLYTADVTRTMPVSGEWTAAQRTLYNAVLEAQTAGIAEVKAGADFLAAHRAAMWVLADHLHHWGILDVPADVACASDVEAPGAGLHRRYTLHGVSHMLGIDVHDCSRARDELYRDGPLGAGYVLTVEPGLYFQPNDLTVPAEWRGIGIRIEDDILVTDGAPVNLSRGLPREPDAVTEWMRDAQAERPSPA